MKEKLLAGIFILVFSSVLLRPGEVYSVCKLGGPLNPVTDLCWQCIFPFSIASIEIIPGPSENNLPSQASTPICVCPAPPPLFYRIGITLSFWEPARYNETVKDPYCFPGIGMGMSGSNSGFGSGGSNEQKANHDVARYTKVQAHHMIYPVWAIMELFEDFVCLEGSGFDVAYLTEVDPLWQDDIMAFIIEPESLLFANPIAQLACIADSISTNLGISLDPLFWCIGSGGSAYPMTGNVNNQDFLQANETASARMQYKMARELLVCDPGVWICNCVPTPIWIKHNYRTHLAKPVRDLSCHPFGRTDLIWGAAKNPPFAGDNLAWMLFRRRTCCAF